MDYLELIKKSRTIKANDRKFPEVKIAFLGDKSTQSLVLTVRALLYRPQFYAQCHEHEAEFNVIDQETLNPDSAFYQFPATHFVLLPYTQQLREKFYSRLQSGPQPFINETVGQIQRWWDAIGSRSKARIIHHLFVLPLERPFGNYTLKMEQTFLSVMHEINRRMIDLSKGYANVFLNDLEYTASLVGKKQWLDETWWVQAKLACHPECVPAVAHGLPTSSGGRSGRSGNVSCSIWIIRCGAGSSARMGSKESRLGLRGLAKGIFSFNVICSN